MSDFGDWLKTRFRQPGTAEKEQLADLENQPVTEDEARANIGDLLRSIRKTGATREKMAYQGALSGAQERGVAFGHGGGSFGSEFGGMSGAAGQVVAPAVYEQRAETESSLASALRAEMDRLENLRQEKLNRLTQQVAGKGGGVGGALKGAATGAVSGASLGPYGAIGGGLIGGIAGAFG